MWFWASDYYPVVHHRCDLKDPYCGVPGSSSSWDPSDPITGTTRSSPRNTSYSLTHTALLHWVTLELTTTITCTFHVIVVDSTRAQARLPSEYAPRALPTTRAAPTPLVLNVVRTLSRLVRSPQCNSWLMFWSGSQRQYSPSLNTNADSNRFLFLFILLSNLNINSQLRFSYYSFTNTVTCSKLTGY